MAYVITETCLGVTDSKCVAVCPVECIHDGKIDVNGATYEQLFINPDDCIDCGICVAECPTNSIYTMDELSDEQKHMAEVNAAFYRQ